MSANESRPGRAPGATPKTFRGVDHSLADEADFDLVTCTPREFHAFLAGYRTGLHQASEAGDRRRDEEDAAVYALAVRNVQALAKLPPYDEHRDAVLNRTYEAGRRNRLEAGKWSA